MNQVTLQSRKVYVGTIERATFYGFFDTYSESVISLISC